MANSEHGRIALLPPDQVALVALVRTPSVPPGATVAARPWGPRRADPPRRTRCEDTCGALNLPSDRGTKTNAFPLALGLSEWGRSATAGVAAMGRPGRPSPDAGEGVMRTKTHTDSLGPPFPSSGA
eukprot:scaffold1041_cov414-Prasinococcus_capsulatus_cf.AAC.1